MPKIHCLYLGCIHLDDNFCSTSSVKLDPDEGCLAFRQLGDAEESVWDDDDLDGFDEWDDDTDAINDDDYDEW